MRLPSQFASTPHVSLAPLGPTDPTHWMMPAVHALVPAMHGLVAPAGGGIGTLHGPTESLGGWPLVLSIVPSQLSSTPLHVSVPGLTAPTQTMAPAWHCFVPNAHGKTLETPHVPPASVGLLSTVPSQLSSRELQVSAVGLTAPMHTSAPFWHWFVPNLQMPTFEVPHCVPTPTGLLSTTPLQSLSRPSQVSGVGLTAPTQTRPPAWHWNVPNVQAPTLD